MNFQTFPFILPKLELKFARKSWASKMMFSEYPNQGSQQNQILNLLLPELINKDNLVWLFDWSKYV